MAEVATPAGGNSQTCSPGNAKVVAAYKSQAPTDAAKKAGQGQVPAARDANVQLGDVVAIEVQNGEGLSSDACRRRPIVLFLNGLPIKGLPAYPPAPELGIWKFVLKVTDESREAWSFLLGKPQFASRTMTASLGLADQAPLASDDAPSST